MKERDIHVLIEQQNPEEKQRIWEKVMSNLSVLSSQATSAEKRNLDKDGKSKHRKKKVSS